MIFLYVVLQLSTITAGDIYIYNTMKSEKKLELI